MSLHYTKEEITQDSFLFASYKHENNAIVFDVLDFLIKEGVRVWYDADLVIGDKWTNVADGLINHPNCKGIIFFNSVESFKSNPIFLERGFALKKIEESKNSATPFFVFPVNIGHPSTMLLLKEVFQSLPDTHSDIERIFPLEYLLSIASIFSNDTIYCYADPKNPDEYKQRLYENIAKAAPSVINKDVIKAKALVQTPSSAQRSIALGIRKGLPANNLPSYFLTKDQSVTYQGEQFLISEGVAYSTQKIYWQVIYCEKDTVVLLSRDIVDTRNGGAGLISWLKSSFKELSFTEEEKSEILEIRLLTEKDMNKISDKELLAFSGASENGDSHWWIDSMNMGALQKVIKKNGAIYSSGYNFRTKKSGVRPVITVHRDFIEKLKQK